MPTFPALLPFVVLLEDGLHLAIQDIVGDNFGLPARVKFLAKFFYPAPIPPDGRFDPAMLN